MKKLDVLKRLLSVNVLAIVCCTMLTGTAYADMVSRAGLIPAGYGYTHGRIPVIEAKGRPEIHDAAIMRYDRNSRIRDVDYGNNQSVNNTRDAYQQGNNRQEF